MDGETLRPFFVAHCHFRMFLHIEGKKSDLQNWMRSETVSKANGENLKRWG